MLGPVPFTVASQANMRTRLNNDGVTALGLAGPLLSQTWTQNAPVANVGNLSFTVNQPWFAPIAGMLINEPNPRALGLSGLDGNPQPANLPMSVIFRIHPQARLRLERLMVANLQAAGAVSVDQSIRPVPSLFLITNPGNTYATSWASAAGALEMPPGTVTMYDEHGLIVDPFAVAAAVAAILAGTPAAAAQAPAGVTPANIAALAPAGRFIHAIDLHGRPWSPIAPGLGNIGLYSTASGNPQLVQSVNDGALYAWSNPSTPGDTALRLAAELNVIGAVNPLAVPSVTRFGWHPLGRMNSTLLAWPAAGAQTPVRDTLRVAACDPSFHLLGNLGNGTRDGVPTADAISRTAQPPQIREGSPVTLLADGRSAIGWIGQVFNALQGGNPGGAFTTGPIFAASPYLKGNWPLPSVPGPAGAWPVLPAAMPVAGGDAGVLASLAPLRTAATANWIAGSNDVLLTMPAVPAGICLRFYPMRILMGTSPDEQPLLRRADGPAIVTSGGADQVCIPDPFGIGPGARPANARLRVDAAITWLPAEPPGIPLVRLIGNLLYPIGGDVPAPPAPQANLLEWNFLRGVSSNPMIGAPARGPFPLASALADPIQFMQQIVRSLTTDANPREAPRLPTMSRNETIFALQLLPAAGADIYRAMLTGGWLTSEIDSHAPRLANPAAAGMHEVHAPALTATSQLGFDLWVAAGHRACPIVPTRDVAQAFTSGPMANLPNNWLLLQANAVSQPPAAPAVPSNIAAALLQTVPAFVETPELAIIPDANVAEAISWVTTQLGNWVTTPNDPELHRQIGRELHSANFGRRDAQWALYRAMSHARELVYIETPLLAPTATGAGAPPDPTAAIDLLSLLMLRMSQEPRLRAVILTPRETPFGPNYEPFSRYFYAARKQVADQFALAVGEQVDGLNTTRPRFLFAHPVGMPGRPLVIRSTTVIIDDVWCMTGASSLSRRGMTFDGSNDVVLVDWQLDRGAGLTIRAHRKALMATHLGVGLTPVGGGAEPSLVGAPTGDWVRLHNPSSAFEAFADACAANIRGKLLPLWAGPDPMAPDAPIAHTADIADPDGRLGDSWVRSLASAIGGGSALV